MPETCIAIVTNISAKKLFTKPKSSVDTDNPNRPKMMNGYRFSADTVTFWSLINPIAGCTTAAIAKPMSETNAAKLVLSSVQPNILTGSFAAISVTLY